MSLNTTEMEVIAVKKHIRAYGRTVLRRLTTNAAKITAPPASTATSVTLSNNIKNIQTKLDKMKWFANIAKEVIWKEGTETIARIKTKVETIFNDQQSA